MRDYTVARTLLTLVEIACWIGVVAGVIIAFSSVGLASRSFGAAPGFVAAIPGIAIGLLSLFGVAMTQMGRASVDSAEYGQQMLKVARDQLDVSKQALKQSQVFQTSFAGLAQATDAPDTVADAVPVASFSQTATTMNKDDETPAKSSDGTLKVYGDSLTYKGKNGYLIDGKWHLNGIPFNTRELLVDYIDTYLVTLPKTPAAKAQS